MPRSKNAARTWNWRKHSTQGRLGNQVTWHFRGVWEFKLTAEFAGFLSEVFCDLLDGVKIRTTASWEPRFRWTWKRHALTNAVCKPTVLLLKESAIKLTQAKRVKQVIGFPWDGNIRCRMSKNSVSVIARCWFSQKHQKKHFSSVLYQTDLTLNEI